MNREETLEYFRERSKINYNKNKEQRLKKHKEWRDKNKDKVNKYYTDDKQKRKDQVTINRTKRKRILIELLGGKCYDCGGTYPTACYDFHHKCPKDKLFTIARKLHRTVEFLKKEVFKCVLLCANCHRIRHSDEN